MDTGLNHLARHLVFGLAALTLKLFGSDATVLNWLVHQLERHRDGDPVTEMQRVEQVNSSDGATAAVVKVPAHQLALIGPGFFFNRRRSPTNPSPLLYQKYSTNSPCTRQDLLFSSTLLIKGGQRNIRSQLKLRFVVSTAAPVSQTFNLMQFLTASDLVFMPGPERMSGSVKYELGCELGQSAKFCAGFFG